MYLYLLFGWFLADDVVVEDFDGLAGVGFFDIGHENIAVRFGYAFVVFVF